MSQFKIEEISAGSLHSAAITDQGKLYTWGHNPDCRLVKKLEYYKSGRTRNYNSPQYC